jgi:hypothetical protein
LASHHLGAILEEHSQQHPTDPLVPVQIVPGDERNPVDYVFVSVDPAITEEPRPDLLEKIRALLTSIYGLQADWKVGKGPDRTRRIHFQVDSFAQAEALYTKLSSHLDGRGRSFQRSFFSKARMKSITPAFNSSAYGYCSGLYNLNIRELQTTEIDLRCV